MKKLIFPILICILLTPFIFFASSEDSKTEISPSLTPALHIIAEDFGMEIAGLVGKNVVFSRDDFCRALNLPSVSSIKVTSLPDASCGKLFLGNTVITEGQTVSAANLDLIIFVPASESECTAAFEFTVEDRAYTLCCSIYMLSSVNKSPSIPNFKDFSEKVKTHSDTPLYSRLFADDPEGDRVKYEILKYPENGLLIMNDTDEGQYTYLPRRDFSGKDEFTYVVKDAYGNYSACSTVEISVERVSTSIVYSDMVGNHANNAAISLAEAGIMLGNVSTGTGLFNPDGEISREDFTVMAMKAMGITDLPVSETDFYDNDSIGAASRPYVAAAKRLSYIDGKTDENGKLCFLPSESITRAEAAKLIDKILDSSSYISSECSLPVFSDADKIPSGSELALKNLNLLGVLRDDNGKINAQACLSRADAACLLAALLDLK